MVPSTYPAAATPEVVLALEDGCRASGARWHRGLVWTKSLFYPGVLEPPRDLYIRAGVIALEMELSALLVLGGLLGLRTGGILVVDGNPTRRASAFDYDPHRPVVDEGVERSIAAALHAIRALSTASR
jgi:uridine phosphorylase